MNYSKKRSFSILHIIFNMLSLTRKHKYLWLLCILLMSADVVFNVGLAWMNEEFLYVIEIGSVRRLNQLIKICIIVIIILLIWFILSSFIERIIKNLVSNTFIIHYFEKFFLIPYKMVKKNHSSDWISRIITDSTRTSSLITESFFNVVYNLMALCVSFIYLSTINIPLAILILSTGPLTFFVGRIFDKRIRNISKNTQEISAENRGNLQDIFEGMISIRAYDNQTSFFKRYSNTLKMYYDLSMMNSFLQEGMWFIINFFNTLIVLVCACVIAWMSIKGTINAGSFMAFYILLSQVQAPFINLSKTWGILQASYGAVIRLNEMDYAEKIIQDDHNDIKINNSDSHLYLKNISFSYSIVQCEKHFIKNLNLKIDRGSKVAIIGKNGSGKSTLLKICLGLYPPLEGEVKINGYLLRNNLEKLRETIAYVPQKPLIFNGSVFENIIYGKFDASDKEVIQAAKLASADSFIKSLPNGYDTIIGRNHLNLSVGEKQRIALARAFIRDPHLLFLDEPTSALDEENEKDILEVIRHSLKDKTAVIVTHNLNLIKSLDKIVVMDQGEIVGIGNHNNLMNKNDIYTELYNDLRKRGKASSHFEPSSIQFNFTQK